MKKHKAFFSAIIFLFFFLSTQAFCMQMKEMLQDSVELKAEDYFAHCRKINAYYDEEWKKLMASVTEDNALAKIDHAQQKLQQYRKNMDDEKKIALFSLKTRNNIPDSIWNPCLQILNGLKRFNKDTRLGFKATGIHDPKVPQWFLSILKHELVKQGHNPATINILTCDDRAYFARNDYPIQYDVIDSRLHMERKDHGTIGINSTILWQDSDYIDLEKGRCMVLVKCVQHLGIAQLCPIINALKLHDGTETKISESDYRNLEKFDRKRSLYQLALKNEEDARCISLMYKKEHNPICDAYAYYCLSDIYFCFKSIAWLKKYFSTNYHAIPLAFKIKEGDFKTVEQLLQKGMVVTKQIVDEVEKSDNKDMKILVEGIYNAQVCCVCYEHPEDMRDMPCSKKHVNNFICRECYNTKLRNKVCPLCKTVLNPYSKASTL